MQGTITTTGPGPILSVPVLTGVDGRFGLDVAAPALAAFPPGCVDRLARASVKYWSLAPLAPGANATITPLATLAEAYRRRLCAAPDAAPGACRPFGDPALYDDAYGLLGFAPQPDVDYMTWDGVVMGTKFGTSLYVLNQRVATVLTGVAEVVASFCPGYATAATPDAQLAAQYGVVDALLALPTAAERSAALSDPAAIAGMADAALAAAAAPEAGLAGGCKRAGDVERDALLSVLAKVGGGVACCLGCRGGKRCCTRDCVVGGGGTSHSRDGPLMPWQRPPLPGAPATRALNLPQPPPSPRPSPRPNAHRAPPTSMPRST